MLASFPKSQNITDINGQGKALFHFITTWNIVIMMINFILFIPTKCWLKARIRGTKVSTNCSPSSSSAAFSMASIRKSTNESSIWSVNRFKESLKSFK